MRDVSICVPYYINHGMLQRHYRAFADMDPKVKAHLEFVVVDDGSPTFPAVPPAFNLGIEVKILRMLIDVRWNQDACRNLAVDQAKHPWVLLTDIDHMMPERLLRQCVFSGLNPALAYNFIRVSEPDMAPYKAHPNSWLMTKTIYLAAGGYDERYAGFYGTDGMFRSRVRRIAHTGLIKEALVRVPRSVTADASTTTYQRKTQEDHDGIHRISHEIRNSGDLEPHRLTFPWKQVFP